jgi:hypothetical protein
MTASHSVCWCCAWTNRPHVQQQPGQRPCQQHQQHLHSHQLKQPTCCDPCFLQNFPVQNCTFLTGFAAALATIILLLLTTFRQ